jgi:hypothetical protein
MTSSNAQMIEKLAVALKEAIVNKEFENKSPIFVVSKGMEVLNRVPELTGGAKKRILVSAIERIAHGRDGIPGTDDDMLPVEYVQILKVIIENNIVDGLIDIISDASKGRFDIIKATDFAKAAGSTCVPECFRIIFAKK